jgi:hypothetical protein
MPTKKYVLKLSVEERKELSDLVRVGRAPGWLAGTYLAACVFLATLLNANPCGIDSGPAELDQQERTALQRARK